MSAADLRDYVNSTQAADEDFIAACWAEAEELVGAYVGENVVPMATLMRATLEVGAELFHRKSAPGGITQFATMDGPAPVRMARDPMAGAYPILDWFLPAGLA